MKRYTFDVFLPFSKVWKQFQLTSRTIADAYELRLKDCGVKYVRLESSHE